MASLRPYGIRIALAAREEAVLPERSFEKVALNRGAGAKVVTEVSDALNWLRGGGVWRP